MLHVKPGSMFGLPPGHQLFVSDLFDYSSRKKRVYAAYTVLMLCRFGRWLSWALCPAFRFFPGLTDMVDGAMSWEMRAQISMRPNHNLPLMMCIGIGAMAFFGVKKGA